MALRWGMQLTSEERQALEKWMTAKRLTTRGVASLLGCSQSSVSKWRTSGGIARMIHAKLVLHVEPYLTTPDKPAISGLLPVIDKSAFSIIERLPSEALPGFLCGVRIKEFPKLSGLLIYRVPDDSLAPDYGAGDEVLCLQLPGLELLGSASEHAALRAFMPGDWVIKISAGSAKLVRFTSN